MQAEGGLTKQLFATLIHSCRFKRQRPGLGQYSIGRVGQYSIGANIKDQKACDKEWEEAIGRCRQLIMEELEQRAGRRKKRSVTGVTGGFTDLMLCAKGLVSEECGGNKVRR